MTEVHMGGCVSTSQHRVEVNIIVEEDRLPSGARNNVEKCRSFTSREWREFVGDPKLLDAIMEMDEEYRKVEVKDGQTSALAARAGVSLRQHLHVLLLFEKNTLEDIRACF